MYSGGVFLQCNKDGFITAGLPRGIALSLDILVWKIQRKCKREDGGADGLNE